jgi:hypothetical protein
MAGNEHEILADTRRSLGGVEFVRRMIYAHGTATCMAVDTRAIEELRRT